MLICKPYEIDKVRCGEFGGETTYLKNQEELLGAQQMGRLVFLTFDSFHWSSTENGGLKYLETKYS